MGWNYEKEKSAKEKGVFRCRIIVSVAENVAIMRKAFRVNIFPIRKNAKFTLIV